MFCSRESFSQRICYIEIRMHFTNLYISILDMLADGVKPALNMLGILVRPWFFGIGYGTIVVTIDHHRSQCARNPPWLGYQFLHPNCFLSLSEAATYSASVVDLAT